MKRIKSTVSYTVPNWNFCNSDNLINGGELTKNTCRFCIKTRSGRHCVLYNEPLSVKDELIYKVRECCKAAAGYASVIDEPPPAPTVDPRTLMKQTIDIYTKNVNELLKQGYPRQIAESAAKQALLGGNR